MAQKCTLHKLIQHIKTQKTNYIIKEKILNHLQKTSHNTAWQSACLVHFLVYILQKCYISSMFYLGVYKSKKISTHSLSLFEDTILICKEDHEKFTILSSIEYKEPR